MNCGSTSCAYPKCGCMASLKPDYRSITDRSRLYMEQWREIWQAVIDRNYDAEYKAVKRHAKTIAEDAGTTVEHEADKIRAELAKNAQHARKNLRRIEQAIGKR